MNRKSLKVIRDIASEILLANNKCNAGMTEISFQNKIVRDRKEIGYALFRRLEIEHNHSFTVGQITALAGLGHHGNQSIFIVNI